MRVAASLGAVPHFESALAKSHRGGIRWSNHLRISPLLR
jgi:hypothetical protein